MPPKSSTPIPNAASTAKLSLPSFLKLLTSNGMSMVDAMAIAKKVFPTHNTPAQLGELTPVKLIELKVDEEGQRKMVLTAIRKAGWIKSKPAVKTKKNEAEADEPVAGPSSSPAKSSPKKRKRDHDLDEPLPEEGSDPPADFAAKDLDFHEVLDEEALQTKSTNVNRAPVMTAWATVVAEKLGFKREEALSVASVYTEMNAASKGVSLGIFEPSKNNAYVAGSTQPFVELMGRNPVLEREDGQWRGIIEGTPVEPSAPFGYIQRAFRQTTPFVMGSMRLLANSFEPGDLNERGYGLYCEFRPEVGGWGKKAEMRMSQILGLRGSNSAEGDSRELRQKDNSAIEAEGTQADGPAGKRPKLEGGP